MSRINKPLFSLALLLFSVYAQQVCGQVNIEELRSETGDKGFSGSLAFELESHTGNTDIQEFGLEARLDFARGPSQTFLLARSDFGWEQGQRFANEGLLHLRETVQVANRIALEFYAQYNYDKTYLLDRRFLAGVGTRLGVVGMKNLQIRFGTGLMMEYERLVGLTPGAVHPPSVTAPRWSNYVSSRITFSDRLASAWTVYVQPRPDAMGDYRVLSDVSFEVEMGGPLSLLISYAMRFDSRTPVGVKQLDTMLDNSLAVAF